jgi:parallel beta-helix repeat protein
MLSAYLVYVGINHSKSGASPDEHVHNLDTGLGYVKIQDAIYAPETLKGQTILVDSGTYHENIIVNKTLSLVGEDAWTTIIEGNGVGSVIELAADNVTLTGFVVRKSGIGYGQSGIALNDVKGCNVSRNNITDNYYGLWFNSATNNTASGNNLIDDNYTIGLYGSSNNNRVLNNNVTASNHAGILIVSSSNNEICENNVTNNQYSIELVSSSSNTILGNNITNNSHGIALYGSSNNNSVRENTLQNNGWGIELDTPQNNRIYHNNFIDNVPQVLCDSHYSNIWDNGYPSGGNYWSDHTGADLDHDGIEENGYIIDENNTDHYPLNGIFHAYNISSVEPGCTCTVELVSNSTISNFSIIVSPEQPGNNRITIDVIAGKGTGFCRATIPHDLLSPPYNVTINDNPIVHGTVYENETLSIIYVSYELPRVKVVIVPEFPSWVTLALFMIVPLLTVIIQRRQRRT